MKYSDLGTLELEKNYLKKIGELTSEKYCAIKKREILN